MRSKARHNSVSDANEVLSVSVSYRAANYPRTPVAASSMVTAHGGPARHDGAEHYGARAVELRGPEAAVRLVQAVRRGPAEPHRASRVEP